MPKLRHLFCFLFAVLLAGIVPAITLRAQSQEEVIVTSAAQVLNEIMAIPTKQIPQSMFANCARDRDRAQRGQRRLCGGRPLWERFGRGARWHGRLAAADVHHLDRRQLGMASGDPSHGLDLGVQDAEERAGLDERQIHDRCGCIRGGRAGGSASFRGHRCSIEIRNPVVFAQPGFVCGHRLGRDGAASRRRRQSGLLRQLGLHPGRHRASAKRSIASSRPSS